MYERIVRYALSTPWAILPEKLGVITELLQFRAAGGRLTPEEIVARVGHDRSLSSPRADAGGGVAVIPIHGVIAHRADSFDASSGGTSAELVSRYLRPAVTDDSVGAILLDVDSPGGTVAGIPELAVEIAQAARVKPVIAYVNALSASAAYWLASQATEIICTPSGMVGSIGVYLMTIDESEALDKAGIKIDAISAGDNKLEGASWLPLTDSARAHLQGQVNAMYAQFVGAVAAGRRVSVADVKRTYGQGRVYDATDALNRGMVDRIGTFEEAVGRALSGRVRPALGISRQALSSGMSETHRLLIEDAQRDADQAAALLLLDQS